MQKCPGCGRGTFGKVGVIQNGSAAKEIRTAAQQVCNASGRLSRGGLSGAGAGIAAEGGGLRPDNNGGRCCPGWRVPGSLRPAVPCEGNGTRAD